MSFVFIVFSFLVKTTKPHTGRYAARLRLTYKQPFRRPGS